MEERRFVELFFRDELFLFLDFLLFFRDFFFELFFLEVLEPDFFLDFFLDLDAVAVVVASEFTEAAMASNSAVVPAAITIASNMGNNRDNILCKFIFIVVLAPQDMTGRRL